MEILHAFVLAVVQGLTEFLPISSSAHLILVPELLGWPSTTLEFVVATHVGTLIAVVVFLKEEIKTMIRGWLAGFNGFAWNKDGMLAWMVGFATIPVGLIGLMFEDLIEGRLHTPLVIGLATLGFGLALGWADGQSRQQKSELNDIHFRDAMLVGCAQALALIPGTSRSGVTMTALLMLGYDRIVSAKFSFLLAVPTILLPGLLKTSELVGAETSIGWLSLMVGVIVSAVVAFLSMQWFLAFVTRVGMKPFVIYRVVLAIVIFVVLL